MTINHPSIQRYGQTMIARKFSQINVVFDCPYPLNTKIYRT